MFGSLFTPFGDDLFAGFRRLENEIEQLFSDGARPAGIRAVRRGTFPPINICATPEQVEVYLFVAGLDPKTVDLSIQQNLLAVAASHKVPVSEEAEYYRRECFDGDFRRVITLPDDIDPDQVDANYRDGVLRITVKRRASARPRQITVN